MYIPLFKTKSQSGSEDKNMGNMRKNNKGEIEHYRIFRIIK